LGRAILEALEAQARRTGARWLRLETGVAQAEALGLYRAAGFIDRDAFGDYEPDPISVFLEKPLSDGTPHARLEAALVQTPRLGALPDRFGAIGLPDAWLVAGCLAQTVWNLAAGRPADAGIKDVDLIYFDPGDLSAATEAAHERRLRERFPHAVAALDVK